MASSVSSRQDTVESSFYPSYSASSTHRRRAARPSTARPRTGVSTLGIDPQNIICAVSESRGVSPTVGIAFLNLDTGEAVLSQISDSQTYVRTIHKLTVFSPAIILIVNTASSPPSKLYLVIEENAEDFNSNLVLLERRYFAETTGLDFIEQLAFARDVDSLKIALTGNYFAVCCFAAVVRYVETALSTTITPRSLRIRYEPSEGSMMIDISTIRSLELIQNLNNPKSRECLFGSLNECQTAMGSRLLKSNILQPLTDADTLRTRYDAVEELSTKEDRFHSVRQALKPMLDADRVLTAMITGRTNVSIQATEQSVNHVIALKTLIGTIGPVFEALTGAHSAMLQNVREYCDPCHTSAVRDLVAAAINDDVNYASSPLDLRNQRTYAVKSGVNGLLDVARQTYKEAMTDAFQHVTSLAEEHQLALEPMFDSARQHYIRLPTSELDERTLPAIFINGVRRKKYVECQTLDLVKINQKISDSHTEVLLMSDKTIQTLIEDVREYLPDLFRISEGIAVLDMLSAFAQVVTVHDYTKPQITPILAIKSARHPIRERIQKARFVPNDVFATQQSRFQIITGCNMSGKSTYMRTIALLVIMAQVGSFLPAQHASIPIQHQLFARVCHDDSVEANVSTFASEMREMAFILKSIDRRSLVIVDELGRGTSTRDGLSIALAIAEALIDSRALVWFATHFRELAGVLRERSGAVNMHLAVDASEPTRMTMLYRLSEGIVSTKNYGLTLAKVLPFPPDVLDFAEEVAEKLERQAQTSADTSEAVLAARRRRLLLGLQDELIQAHHGSMTGPALTARLQRLQRDFVVRMTTLEAQSQAATSEVNGSDMDMMSDA